MPLRDGTGPSGEGPRTGRGLGPCGRGLARGRGFGWRRCFYAEPYAEPAAQPITLPKEQQKKVLEAEVIELEAELKAIKEKLKEFE